MADIERARRLRKQETWAEKLMRRWLRDRRDSGYKFRRQHPIGDYALDFFCEEARLNIELDGSQHGYRISENTIRNGKSFWSRTASKHCGSGIHICEETPKASATPFLTNCRPAPHIHCRTIQSR